MFPQAEISLVPVLLPGPILAYSAPPFNIIQGTAAMVSTLLTTVGFCHRPFTAGKGGLMRGFPLLPSSDSSEARDNHPFDEQMRQFLHQVAVLESPGFAFIGIADEITRSGILINKAPFHPCRKACSAASSQAGNLYLFHYLLRRHAFQDFFH